MMYDMENQNMQRSTETLVGQKMNIFHNKDSQSLEHLKHLNISLDTRCSYSIVELSGELTEIAECNVMYEE